MKCPNCKCVVPNNSEKCGFCGGILNNSETETIRVFDNQYYDNCMVADIADEDDIGLYLLIVSIIISLIILMLLFLLM